MIEIRGGSAAIGIEDARRPALQDRDPRLAERLRSWQLQQRPGHGVGAVRAAQNDDPAAFGRGDDIVGRGKSVVTQQHVRRQHAPLGIVREAQARLRGALLPRLPAAQCDDRGASDKSAGLRIAVADEHRDSPIGAQMDRLDRGIEMDG